MKARKQSNKKSARKTKNYKKKNSRKSKRIYKNKKGGGGGWGDILEYPCKCGYLNFKKSEIGDALKEKLTSTQYYEYKEPFF